MENELPKPISSDLSLLFDLLHKAVIDGEHNLCRQKLANQNPLKINREWAEKFADIAVRAHAPLFALKSLHRFIFPENTFSEPATISEKMTYARALYHLSAVDDAIEILSSLDAKLEPEVLFLRACAHIFNWNYDAAILDLKSYLNSNRITPYRRIVGQVNLVASLISIQDFTTANFLLDEIQNECRTHSYHLLLGNSYELRSQIEIFKGNYSEALVTLKIAESFLKTQGALYALYIKKWQAVAHCLQSPTPDNLAQLDLVKQKATELSHWSTLRECDLFQAIATHNELLLRKIIMGTASEMYRQRARKLFKTDVIFRGHFDLKLLGPQTENYPEYRFNPHQKQAGRAALYEKPLLYKLFEALTTDFYQPSHISLLFKKVYPSEKFNPFTSPARVLQLLRRLDSWLLENKVPLKVRFKKSEFCLKALCHVSIHIQRGKKFSQCSAKNLQLEDLRNAIKEKSLSVDKIGKILNISDTSVRRLVAQGILTGEIKKLGSGRATLYQAVSPRQKKKVA